MTSNVCIIVDSPLSMIMNRFRDKDVFLRTENDVMVISPLGSATEFSMMAPECVPECVTMTSYLYCKVTSSLSCTVLGNDKP